ncbi:winged helix-turn-helix domain-containing protein [Marinoscillum pacificum]|uniref:winged helix-turn-helix domain-containing protein n=1 Tax=Marinoscillum pacificum TaxID=392723 RepID=UPI002157730D|nr:LysR family transcriptional regulator [Marinoscillum pacificum]
MKELRFRCWVDDEGEKFFGPGPAQLLAYIDEEGSLAKAAKKMNMSYKKAWDLVSTLNAKGSEPYVISQKGGQKGGGAELTQKGKDVLKAYQNLIYQISTVISADEELIKLL